MLQRAASDTVRAVSESDAAKRSQCDSDSEVYFGSTDSTVEIEGAVIAGITPAI